MFLLPFLKYLKPFRVRLTIAIICMFGVGFFGTYNIILVKPALDIIFDEGPTEKGGKSALEKKTADLQEKVEKHQKKINKDLKSDKWVTRNIAKFKQLYFPLELRVKSFIIEYYKYASKNPRNSLWIIASLLIGLSIIKGLFDYGFSYNLSYGLYSAVITMKSDIFRHILDQDMRFFTTKSVGFLMSRITSDVTAMRTVFDMIIKNGALESIKLMFIMSLLLMMDWRLTMLVFLGILPAAGLLAYFAYLIKRVTGKQKRKQDVLSAVMNESLGNIRLVKSFKTEKLECDKFDGHNQMLFVYEMQRRIAKFAASPIMEVLGSIGLGLVLVAAGYYVIDVKTRSMDASDFMVYLGALSMFYTPLKHISRVNVSWQQGAVSAQRILEILDLQPTVTDPDPAVPSIQIPKVRSGLQMRNVTFRYLDKNVLNNVSLDIPCGKTTAIVGRSGSGKSTIANILLRLYDPDEGTVLLDGHDLRAFKIKDLRSHYGIVTQETLLFHDSVANNIAYGSDSIEIARIEEAARAAHAHEFVMALDGGKGYDSTVGPSGSQLSGGQRQRIAIARAFYRDPEILILDEATSSLDTQSEAAIQEALEVLMKTRTTVVISHRLSTIYNADNIIVMEDGKLVEQGTHAQLLAMGGYYATLCKHGELSDNSMK